MAVILDSTLPSGRRLADAGMPVLTPDQACADITIGLLNLMPNREDTEYDFFQLLAPAPLNIRPVLVKTATHVPRHPEPQYVAEHYRIWDDIDITALDGLIVTGAPLDFVDFRNVDYWHEMTRILDCTMTRQLPTLYVCWGAYAAMYHRYGVVMEHYPQKLHGIFHVQKAIDPDGILDGLPQSFPVPFSRFATWGVSAAECPDIITVARNHRAGIYIARDRHAPHYYITGHVEYDALTLHREYCRDSLKGMNPPLPENYYPNDNPEALPTATWRQWGLKIFSNWLNSISK